MIPIQDHKRIGVGDTGPNTGGMGSYSCEDHGLPFATKAEIKKASDINAKVLQALFQKTGEKYKGILYGGFIVTKDGVRLIEYNARFGDPEALNVLAILENDLAEIFEAIVEERLDEVEILFQSKATVCKYVVPEGYPDSPVKNVLIDTSDVPEESGKLKRFDAAVEKRNGKLFLTGSRAIAFVGIGDTLAEAEHIAENAVSAVKGLVYHRPDIGTSELVQKRVDHIQALRKNHENSIMVS